LDPLCVSLRGGGQQSQRVPPVELLPTNIKTTMRQNSTLLAVPLFLLLAITITTKSKCLAFSPSAQQREQVVFKYFDGVNKKDRDQIASCFAETATIRDVCSINNSSERTVNPNDLADRCMEFLKAHPDCTVNMHYGPKCSHDDHWVVAHWYETGHWTGDSMGVKATGNPMQVEGQTRFLVNDDLRITSFVVTRTFTEWEEALQRNQK